MIAALRPCFVPSSSVARGVTPGRSASPPGGWWRRLYLRPGLTHQPSPQPFAFVFPVAAAPPSPSHPRLCRPIHRCSEVIPAARTRVVVQPRLGAGLCTVTSPKRSEGLPGLWSGHTRTGNVLLNQCAFIFSPAGASPMQKPPVLRADHDHPPAHARRRVDVEALVEHPDRLTRILVEAPHRPSLVPTTTHPSVTAAELQIRCRSAASTRAFRCPISKQ